jgi:hypothetical protein
MSPIPATTRVQQAQSSAQPQGLEYLRAVFGVGGHGAAVLAATLPFANGDVTAGSEHELQVVVIGAREQVDLPLTIEASNFYKNIERRIETGEAPKRVLSRLRSYLGECGDGVWDNSWVRFPVSVLSPLAKQTVDGDLRADKGRKGSRPRGDAHRFRFRQQGEEWLRVPVSYLLKLALADALGHDEGRQLLVRATGERLLDHFLSDNTSPETFSFHVVQSPQRIGADLARESAKRFLLSQLLTSYANRQFRLMELGQQARVCFAPNPPVRQKRLNDCISDAFYRELFMSPCLSGWDRGEEKHQYMGLCHQTLSRSQLNAVISLREAGIITSNLVVLPNISNVSLANNGVHISLGSKRLTALLADRSSGYTSLQEKQVGDLVIKIVEHFLPLFVGTCSAAPYRLDFTDFHPEKALGFLPHELHATHLRMFWRRWCKKAKLKVFGQPVTPFGPYWLDSMVRRLFRLRGDFIPDHRLIDYLVALPSTHECPALDGTPGNTERLKEDLATMGMFDPRMATYLIFRMREYSRMGFTGFEGRSYSLFPTFADMAEAADLQALVTAFAYQLILSGEVTHADIPDQPFTESERRQAIFATAIGLPTFFVRHDTGNRLLKAILGQTGRTRPSHRYGDYTRVRSGDYRLALLDFLRQKGAALIEATAMAGTLDTFSARLTEPALSASGRLTSGILAKSGERSPFALRAEEFNLAAEEYYREDLRGQHMREALALLAEDFAAADRDQADGHFHSRIAEDLAGMGFSGFIARHGASIAADTAPAETLRQAIALLLLSLHRDAQAAGNGIKEGGQ